MISFSFDANFIPNSLSNVEENVIACQSSDAVFFFVGTERSGFGSVMFSCRQRCLVSQHPTPTEFQQELPNNLPLGSSENSWLPV